MIEVFQADYANPRHGEALLRLLDAYARDPMGGGAGLSDDARRGLLRALAARPEAVSVLARVDDEYAGLANCFEGFSTFACRPLLNIHDVVVLPAYRGRGLAALLLEAVQGIAEARGCCKLTLEVLEGNRAARAAYRRFGFRGYELDPDFGRALFWEKKL